LANPPSLAGVLVRAGWLPTRAGGPARVGRGPGDRARITASVAVSAIQVQRRCLVI